MATNGESPIRFRSRRMRPRRGIALVLVLFVIFIEAVLGFAAVSLATLDSQSVVQEQLASRALGLARGGLARACKELKSNPNWVGTSAYAGNSNGWITIAGTDNGKQKVTVVVDTNSTWFVTSTGRYLGAQRTLESYVEFESFARYAYFTDSELSTSGGTIWFMDRDAITGAAHTNGYFSISDHPQFSSRTTSANGSDSYYNSSAFSYSQGSSTYTTPSKFYRYFNGYSLDYPMAYNDSESFLFAGGQPTVTMPSDLSTISTGASKPGTGQQGYVVTGNAEIRLGYNSSSNTGYAVIMQSGKSNVTVSLTSDTTIYVKAKTTSGGAPSGTSSGKATIKAASGSTALVKGRLTIGANGGMDIYNSIKYKQNSSGEYTGLLGLVSPGAIIVKADKNTVADFEIDAAIMSTNNSFTVENYNSGVARGTLTVRGGIIQKYRGPVGTFSSQSGNIMTGYAKNYVYDSRLLTTPPPSFPNTGKIVLRSFKDKGALGSD